MKRLILITSGLQGKWKRKDSMELSQSPQNQAIDNTTKPKTTIFSLCRSSKGTNQYLKQPPCAWCTWKRKVPKGMKKLESEDPDSINRVMEEFMVHLVRAVKDAQVEEKCCYNCSSSEHFICDCPLVRPLRENMQLDCKEGTASKKGAWAP